MAQHMMHGGGRERPGVHGFTILEVVVAVAVISAAIAMIAPALVAMTRRSSESATQDQARATYTAIFGDAARGTFGFLGDVGRLPTSFAELTSQGSLPGFHTSDGATAHVGNVGYGWSGPYLSSFFPSADLLTDAWGQTLSYADTGANAGKVISLGADGTLGTGDDITFPTYTRPTTGTLYVVVNANGIGNPFGAGAKVYYPVNGEQAVTATQKFDPSDTFSEFDGMAFTVPAGVRVIAVSHTGVGAGGGGCTTVSRRVPVNVVAGRANVIEVRMDTKAVVAVTGNFSCTVPD
jgi:prepilin-type N-terminal cleavage/methylation domain-containing protein